jgi:glutamyl-tRNA(Gln) amidotransferase subunit D
MDYSARIREMLGRASEGDRIRVTKNGESHEGSLMPKATGDPDTVVLKLDNGYNIGIIPEKVEILKKHTAKKIEKKLSFSQDKPKISIISTGGTITSKVDYHTGGVKSLASAEELLLNVPKLADIVNVKNIVTPFTKMSEDMDSTDWPIIAKAVAKELNSDSEGVIVTHGTDTLHFTAAALSFMLKDLTKPVVLVGAQRSSDRGSSDASMNLICGVHTALSGIAEVGICMHGSTNDDYCLFTRGTKVRKMHTSRRDAFRPINDLPLAKIWPDGRIERTNNYRKRTEGTVKADTAFEHSISLLKAYPGSDPSVMDYLVDKGCKGFVLEGTGLGQIPNNNNSWLPTVKAIVKKGIPVVITSQTLYGRVNPYVYSNARFLLETGAIFGEDMLSEVAYIKLGHVLGHTTKLEEVKKMMLTNIAGEITERIVPGTFLY